MPYQSEEKVKLCVTVRQRVWGTPEKRREGQGTVMLVARKRSAAQDHSRRPVYISSIAANGCIIFNTAA